MDSLDLLAREDEFKKLNKQLEKKTESLMKEIEHAMVSILCNVNIFLCLIFEQQLVDVIVMHKGGFNRF